MDTVERVRYFCGGYGVWMKLCSLPIIYFVFAIFIYNTMFQPSFCVFFTFFNTDFGLFLYLNRLAHVHIWSYQKNTFFTIDRRVTIFDHFIFLIFQHYNEKKSKMFISKKVLQTSLVSWSMTKKLNFTAFLWVPGKGFSDHIGSS